MEQCAKCAIIFMLLWSFATANQQHLLCKTMEDIFTDDGASDRPGIQGASSPPAVVDYDRINKIISEKVATAVAKAVAEQNSRLTEGERNVTELNKVVAKLKATLARLERNFYSESSRPTSLPELVKSPTSGSNSSGSSCKGGLHYRHKCYTIPLISSSRVLSHSQAAAECTETGALLAEIHDKTQQEALNQFALLKMPSGLRHVYLWVGMEYQRGRLHYRSGKTVLNDHLQWDQRYPTTYSTRKTLLLEVGNDGDSSVGLLNVVDWSHYNGVICENDV